MKLINLLRIIACTVFTLSLSLTEYSCTKKEGSKTTVTTKPVTEITTSSAKSGGNVSVTGKASVGLTGICWSETPSPTTRDYFTTDNTGAGEFSSTMRNLNPNTKYYVRAYATIGDEIMYGEELDFTTESLPTATVTVYTNEITEITSSSARCGGVVTTNGDISITTRGVCWNTSQNPTVNNSHTSDGQGLGLFTSTLNGLDEETVYYVKAYATTSEGGTFYGDEKSFSTLPGNGNGNQNDSIIVVTNDITNISQTQALCGGSMSIIGNLSVTAKGVCWNTSGNPSIADLHTSDGTGTSSFSSNLTALNANTKYFVKAFVSASNGKTYYGEQKEFTTLSENGGDETIEIITNDITDISTSNAKSGGNVICSNDCTIYVKGVCWSTSHNPTVSDAHTSDGQGQGAFVSTLTGLTPGTNYYVKAYAQIGNDVIYGDEKSFSTSMGLPSEVEVTEVSYNFIKIRVAPSSSVDYYYSRIVGIGNAVRHDINDTILIFNDLSPETTYVIEFSFYDDNDNLLDTEQIPVTTIEQPYEYAYVTVSLDTHTPVSLKLQFVPSANTSYYYLNIGETLTSTWQRTGTLTINFDCLEPNTEYTFSVVAYDNNGVAGEVIHPKFTTDPAPYENYFNIGNNFYQLNTAQLSTEVLSNGYGQKVLTLRSSSICWIRIMYLCSTSELNLNWSSGSFNIVNNSSYHQYNGMYSRTGTILNLPSGTFTISKNGSMYTIDISVDNGYMKAHFSGTPTS